MTIDMRPAGAISAIPDQGSLVAALDSIDQGVCVVDSELRILAVNKRLVELVPDAAARYQVGADFRDIVRRDARAGHYGNGDPEELAEREIAALSRLEPHRCERTESDGRILEIVCSRVPGGGFVSTYTDITARRASEQTMERLNRILDRSLNETYILDPYTLHFHQVSEAARRNLGYKVEELRALTLFDLTLSERHVELESAIATVCRGSGQRLVIETVFLRKDSTEYPVELSLQFLGSETPPMVVGIANDITRRCYAEQALRSLCGPVGAGRLPPAVPKRGLSEPTVDLPCEPIATAGDSADMAPEARKYLRAIARLIRRRTPETMTWPFAFDVSVAVLLALGVSLALGALEFVEWWHEFARTHVSWRLDEAVSVGVGMVVGALWLSLRQAHHSRRQLASRARAEQRLRESERRFRDYTESASDWLWEMDEDLRYTKFSPEFATEAKLDTKNILGRTRWEMAGVDPDREPRWRRHREQLNAWEPFRDFRFAVSDATGRRRHLRVSGKPLFDNEGRFKGYRGTATEETERREAEAALRRQQSMFEAIFHGAPDALVMADPSHEIIMANPAAAELFGYETTDMTGVAAASLYDGEGMGLTDEVQASDAGDDEERSARIAQFRRKNGDVFPGELVGTVIRGEDGDIFGYLSLIRDVTIRQDAEERQRQGQKLEALGEMAGGIAHEFNNLLTSISGFTKMALKKPDDVERVTGCLKEVVDASSRAADLTRQMLTFSHKQVLEPKVVRVVSVLGNTDKLIRAFIEESIELTIEIVDPDVCIEVDPARLSQALVNLVNNARHAMPYGGALALRCAAIDIADGFVSSHGDSLPPGPYAQVDVIDTGTGITPDVRAKIFDPYFTTKEKGKGTGLGLSLVYGMVKNSNGVISVNSFVGAGTKFSIYLPVVDKLPSEAPRDAGVKQEVVGGSETILVAEDDNQLRTFVRTILEDAGFQVLTATDGVNALEVHGENADAIDLLVTDVIMPKMGGVDLVKELTSKRPDLKVVYMSGYAPELTEQINDIGDEFCFLRKPFEPDALSRLVREALNS